MIKTNKWINPVNIIAIIALGFTAFSTICLPDSQLKDGIQRMIPLFKIIIWIVWIVSISALLVYTFKAKREKKQYETLTMDKFKELIDKKDLNTKSLQNKIFIALAVLEVTTISFFSYYIYNDITTKKEENVKAIAIEKKMNDKALAIEKERSEKKTNRIEQKKLKCNQALYEACIEIYRTVYGYNRVLKKVDSQTAIKAAEALFSINGDQLERARNDYFEVIDSNRLYAIDDALKSLHHLSEDIVKSKNRKFSLYNNICKIDSSFNAKESIIDLDNRLKNMPVEAFAVDERMSIK